MDLFMYKTLVDAPNPSERYILHLGTLGPGAVYLPGPEAGERRGGHRVSLCQVWGPCGSSSSRCGGWGRLVGFRLHSLPKPQPLARCPAWGGLTVRVC